MDATGRALAVALAIAVAAIAPPVASGQATPAPTQVGSSPAALFSRLIRADRSTTGAVTAGLRSRRLFVDADVTFADLTGDGKPDAVARVDTGGAAGDIAIYVFSADGAPALRTIYRNQSLYRATVRLQGTVLLVRTPVYEAGDELCCPGQLLERSLTWSPAAKRMILRSTRRVDVPVQAIGTAPVT